MAMNGLLIRNHTRKDEFQPVAENPTIGSQDFCLTVDGDLKEVKVELETKNSNYQ